MLEYNPQLEITSKSFWDTVKTGGKIFYNWIFNSDTPNNTETSVGTESGIKKLFSHLYPSYSEYIENRPTTTSISDIPHSNPKGFFYRNYYDRPLENNKKDNNGATTRIIRNTENTSPETGVASQSSNSIPTTLPNSGKTFGNGLANDLTGSTNANPNTKTGATFSFLNELLKYENDKILKTGNKPYKDGIDDNGKQIWSIGYGTRSYEGAPAITEEEARRRALEHVYNLKYNKLPDIIGSETWNKLTPKAQDAITMHAYQYGPGWWKEGATKMADALRAEDFFKFDKEWHEGWNIGHKDKVALDQRDAGTFSLVGNGKNAWFKDSTSQGNIGEGKITPPSIPEMSRRNYQTISGSNIENAYDTADYNVAIDNSTPLPKLILNDKDNNKEKYTFPPLVPKTGNVNRVEKALKNTNEARKRSGLLPLTNNPKDVPLINGISTPVPLGANEVPVTLRPNNADINKKYPKSTYKSPSEISRGIYQTVSGSERVPKLITSVPTVANINKSREAGNNFEFVNAIKPGELPKSLVPNPFPSKTIMTNNSNYEIRTPSIPEISKRNYKTVSDMVSTDTNKEKNSDSTELEEANKTIKQLQKELDERSGNWTDKQREKHLKNEEMGAYAQLAGAGMGLANSLLAFRNARHDRRLARKNIEIMNENLKTIRSDRDFQNKSRKSFNSYRFNQEGS